MVNIGQIIQSPPFMVIVSREISIFNFGGDTVSEEKKLEILDSIREALSEVPDQYQADVGKSITHDIGVMAKTIGIVNANQPG